MKCLKIKNFWHLRNLRFQRKAQGLSVNTIIIAAIALIVLVVLIAVFTGRIGIFGDQLSRNTQLKCDDNSIMWAEDCSSIALGDFTNVPSGKVCCKGARVSAEDKKNNNPLGMATANCGNGVREGTEQCDRGAQNGQAGSKCTTGCVTDTTI